MASDIDISDVSKQFGSFTAVDDLSLTVESGDIFGFLGPNGAGKSTTINMILGFLQPSAGDISVLGRTIPGESKEMRRDIGVLPDGYGVYQRLSGREHLEFEIDTKGADDDPDEILERVGLDPNDADRRAGGYSKGMTQRLVLGMALVGDPDLLILDEPSSGLDPNGVREMRELVVEENERGTTVFFSSHILAQVEAVADRVAILDEGQLIAEDSIEALRDRIGTKSSIELTLDGDAGTVAEEVRGRAGVENVTADGSTLLATCIDAAMAEVVAMVYDRMTIQRIVTDEASLEDLFVQYTTGGTQ